MRWLATNMSGTASQIDDPLCKTAASAISVKKKRTITTWNAERLTQWG
jgi:hypothetical protein